MPSDRAPSALAVRTSARALALVTLTASTVSCGDSSTGPEAGEPADIIIENGDFTLTGEGLQQQLDISVLDTNGDPVTGSDLTFFTFDPNVASISQEGLVTAVGNGESEVTVAVGLFTDRVTVTVDIPSAEIDLETETLVSGGVASDRYFTFEVPESTDPSALYVRLQGGSGDADIRLRLGEQPTPEMVDCESPAEPEAELLNLEFCAVLDPDPGTWHLLVEGFTSFQDIQLEAVLLPVLPLETGVPSAALSAGRNDLIVMQTSIPPALPVPDEGLAASAPGTLVVTTEGGTGDADLFATPLGAFSYFTIRFMPCISGLVGNEESCEVAQPDDALWTVFLVGYEAFEGVMVTADYLGPSGVGAG